MIRKNKNIYIVLILIILFCISVGYAAMNRVLNITGNSEVKQNTWDIHFDNVKVTTGSVEAALPVIDTTTRASVNFNIMLNLPGDFYEFTVDVKNFGTIDAMIDSIEKTPELTEQQKKYINYIIEYQNGEQIQSKQLVKSNKFVRIKVRVEYRTDLTEIDLPTTIDTLNLGFTVNYVQSDGTGILVNDNGVIASNVSANGSLDDIGTIVTIGDQQFYTIGVEGGNVKLLSMYNLYVGGIYYESTSWIPYNGETTGMQDENMKGNVQETQNFGTTYFGEDSSDYTGSIVEGYVNNYRVKLEENFNLDVVEARLITLDELTDPNTFNCNYTCSNNYPWIYSTSYWSMSSISKNVWAVLQKDKGIYDEVFDNEEDYGVRPVIVISKDYFN